MELLQLLTSQLGITEEQAKGGAGLLFKMAKEKLGSADFGQVAGAVPEVESMMSSAPESGGGLAGALGGLASSLGGGGGNIGDLANLAGGFKKLGLDSDLIGRFVPIVMSFVQSKGGSAVKDILDKVVKL